MKRFLMVCAVMLIGAGCTASAPMTSPTPPSASTVTSTPSAPTSDTSPAQKPAADLVWPLNRAAERITKKMYGTYVTPKNSPIQPERFTGYHTGTDFETFPEEKDADVAINAICAGKLLQAGTASGYGGYAVESCTINGQAVTVVYGHLRAVSINVKVGQGMAAGQVFAVLGTGYSKETDGERKHLHLDIYRGTAVNIRGYVSTKDALKDWIDPQTVLKD